MGKSWNKSTCTEKGRLETIIGSYIDYGKRNYLFLCLGPLMFMAPMWPEGFRKHNLMELKHTWIQNDVRDLNNKDFAKLDEEDPPTPLPPKTSMQQFREEFLRRYSTSY